MQALSSRTRAQGAPGRAARLAADVTHACKQRGSIKRKHTQGCPTPSLGDAPKHQPGSPQHRSTAGAAMDSQKQLLAVVSQQLGNRRWQQHPSRWGQAAAWGPDSQPGAPWLRGQLRLPASPPNQQSPEIRAPRPLATGTALDMAQGHTTQAGASDSGGEGSWECASQGPDQALVV